MSLSFNCDLHPSKCSSVIIFGTLPEPRRLDQGLFLLYHLLPLSSIAFVIFWRNHLVVFLCMNPPCTFIFIVYFVSFFFVLYRNGVMTSMSNTTPLPIFVSFTMTPPPQGVLCVNYYGEPWPVVFSEHHARLEHIVYRNLNYLRMESHSEPGGHDWTNGRGGGPTLSLSVWWPADDKQGPFVLLVAKTL